jgi:lysophospholipase L1-like esterase
LTTASNNQRKYLVLVLITSITFSLLLGELLLRLVGFSYKLYPDTVEFGFPDPVEITTMYRVDRELFWVPRDYDRKLSVMISARPSIVFMGDSCTEYGIYHEYLNKMISDRYPGNKFVYSNVGVGGWSSYQGLQQLKRDIVDIKPKIISIYYGWNDHWIGFGIEDKDVIKINESLLFRLNKLRIVQLINKARIALLMIEETRPLRVSIKDYKKNLTEISRIAKDNDIIPILITAPSAHIKGKEPAHLKERWLDNLSDLVPLHDNYNSVVREVAQKEGVILIDLAAYLDQFSKETLKREYFMVDGIHPNEIGHKVIAEIIYMNLDKLGLIQHLLN